MTLKRIYPRSREENYRYRAFTLSNAKDEQFQAAVRQLCEKNILYWINTFGWIYEPRKDQYQKLGYDTPHIAFITWKFQDDFIRWMVKKIQAGEDGILEKSRDMGASWMALAVIVWFWLFPSFLTCYNFFSRNIQCDFLFFGINRN